MPMGKRKISTYFQSIYQHGKGLKVYPSGDIEELEWNNGTRI